MRATPILSARPWTALSRWDSGKALAGQRARPAGSASGLGQRSASGRIALRASGRPELGLMVLAGELCDTNYTSVTKLRKDYLPAARRRCAVRIGSFARSPPPTAVTKRRRGAPARRPSPAARLRSPRRGGAAVRRLADQRQPGIG